MFLNKILSNCKLFNKKELHEAMSTLFSLFDAKSSSELIQIQGDQTGQGKIVQGKYHLCQQCERHVKEQEICLGCCQKPVRQDQHQGKSSVEDQLLEDPADEGAPPLQLFLQNWVVTEEKHVHHGGGLVWQKDQR